MLTTKKVLAIIEKHNLDIDSLEPVLNASRMLLDQTVQTCPSAAVAIWHLMGNVASADDFTNAVMEVTIVAIHKSLAQLMKNEIYH